MDLPLLIIVLSLLAIGLVVLFSASYAYAHYAFGDSYYYISRQFGFAVFGVAAMLFISTVDYHQFKRFRLLIFYITVALLLIVLLVPSMSSSKGDAVRWINIAGIQFQPSEIAKFTIVIMLASIISSAGDKVSTFKRGMLPCFVVTGIIAGLIVAEKHVSATIIIVCIAIVIMFVGGVKMRYFVAVGGVAGVVLVYLVFFTSQFTYALHRIQGWIDPFNPPDDVNTYQTVQSLYTIGSGQFWGVGLGQSKQKYMYLPEARNDFIFPIACEELGFVGAVVIIGLFIALVWRGVVISMNSKDKFGMLVGMGITFTVGIQAAFNICVVTNVFPNTGISLPFFSYGGTSLLMLLGEMGVLLSISRGSYTEKL